MKEVDRRDIWENMNELQLLLKISQFIEKNSIKTCSQYQEKLSEFPKEVPSVWFIIQRYGSWNNLLRKLIGKKINIINGITFQMKSLLTSHVHLSIKNKYVHKLLH
ncbi:hypothetical protein PMT97_02910 [Enterococcus faecalis]|uniref:hypothetical protein n=1 Tax=Enterococcus faecalis TaxID=1351 RepID=UPI000E088E65|nr:hypothetical protein [Enterococcus faecalis]MDB1623048.1 hypothetical protein [Enterococcus faecalis]MDH5040312.1 hypothetical protein [Enterococcus faecalis]MDV2932081.1 hypothetical protein [Enterococcus faecalis]RBR48070.1 hypothetical protein EB28_00720 [Enterococcus faecalis]